MGLQYLFPGSIINGTIIIALLVALILYIVLNKTTLGYELKSVGFNRNASTYAGINAKRNIVVSMIIAGAVAGLAGAMVYLVIGKNIKPENYLPPEGFTGIAISLLGLSNPIGVVIAGLFYGSLERGGFYMQLLDFYPEIIDIIIAVIIYSSALGLIMQKVIQNILRRRARRKTPTPKAADDGRGGDVQ
jgi:simple sugar transport system permease protein